MVRSVSRFLFGLSVLGSLMLMPTRAYADSINFNSGGSLTSLVLIGGSFPNNFDGYVQAGALNWTWAGTPPAGFAQSFYSYCVDLAHFVTPTQEVTVQSSTGFSNGVVNGGSKAAWLVNQFAGAVGNATEGAALQLAIWEATYDTSNNLAAGGFTVSSSTAVMNKAKDYLDSLYSSNMTAVANILNSTRPTGQDQITAQVSEPSTLLVMGLAFFGFATLARRRSTAVQ